MLSQLADNFLGVFRPDQVRLQQRSPCVHGNETGCVWLFMSLTLHLLVICCFVFANIQFLALKIQMKIYTQIITR